MEARKDQQNSGKVLKRPAPNGTDSEAASLLPRTSLSGLDVRLASGVTAALLRTNDGVIPRVLNQGVVEAA